MRAGRLPAPVRFDLEALIAGVGADYELDDMPAMDCPRCGVNPLASACPSPTRRKRRRTKENSASLRVIPRKPNPGTPASTRTPACAGDGQAEISRRLSKREGFPPAREGESRATASLLERAETSRRPKPRGPALGRDARDAGRRTIARLVKWATFRRPAAAIF